MAKIYTNIEDLNGHFKQKKYFAEKVVFDVLIKKLDSSWSVYYSVDWIGNAENESMIRDGEIDFVLTNLKYGFYVVEVKGGVEVFKEDKSWYSVDSRHEKHKIKNPFNQAKDNKYFIKKLFEEEINNGKKLYLNMYHLVIFPNCNYSSGLIPFDIDSNIVVDSKSLGNIKNALIRIHNNSAHNDEKTLNNTIKQIDWFEKKFNSNIRFSKSLIDWVNETEREIIKLSIEQNSLIDAIIDNKRIDINGVAGSGKTIIAIDRAVMFSKTNQRTLLLCFNALLGNYFEEISKNISHLTASNLDKFVSNIVKSNRNNSIRRKIDLNKTIYQTLNDQKEEFATIILDDKFDYYDVIIIDEAQDFDNEILSLLELMLVDDGRLYRFFDYDQNVHFKEKIKSQNFTYRLNNNYRNGKPIFDLLKKHLPNQLDITHKGPDGPKVKISNKYSSNNANQLFHILRVEISTYINLGFKPEDIVVLTAKSHQKTFLKDFSMPDVPISLFSQIDKGLRIETFRRFKGLESPIIILTEMEAFDPTFDSESWNRMCYVCYSRCRSHLTIIPSSIIDIKNL